MPAEFKYRITMENYSDVKQAFLDIQEQYKSGDISQRQFLEGTRQLGRESRLTTGEFRSQMEIVKATSPQLLAISNAMYAFGGAARLALAATNALNIAQLVMQGQTQQQLSLELKLVDLERQKAIAIANGHPEQAVLIDQQINQVRQQQINLNNQLLYQHIQEGVQLVAIGALTVGETARIIQAYRAWTLAGNSIPLLFSSIGASMAGMVPAIVGGLTVAGGAVRAFGVAIYTALGPWGLLALGIVTAATLIILNWDKVTAAWGVFIKAIQPGLTWLQNTFGPIFKQIWDAAVTIATVAWTALRSGFVTFWNGLAGVANAGIGVITAAVNGYINLWISGINALIAAFNRVASFLHLGTIGYIPTANFVAPKIPTISAATGFEGQLTQDTQFFAHAGENVSIRPANSASGGGSGQFNVYVMGSVTSEKELFGKLDRYMKIELRRRGFNGLLG